MVIVEVQIPTKPGVYKVEAPKGAVFVGASFRMGLTKIQTAASPMPDLVMKVMHDETETEKTDRIIGVIASGAKFDMPEGALVDFIDSPECIVRNQIFAAHVLELLGADNHPSEA